MTTQIAILASGRGSNFEALVRAIHEGMLSAEIVALVCDRPGAPVLELAKAAGIPALLVPPQKGEKRRVHDEAVLKALEPYAPRFLVMAGYMRIVTDALLTPFRSERGYHRVVNIHPSLLPAFPGVDSYAQAFGHGCQVSGVSVHLVETQVDSGPLLAQESFSIKDCRSEKEVEQRGLAIEHRLYPQTLSWALPERFEVETRQGRLCVRPN